MDARTVVDHVIQALDADFVLAVGADPRAGVLQIGLTVEALDTVPTRGSGGWCDGASFVDDGRIMYRPTLSLRENFTICHELGHHLLRLDEEAMDWVYEHDDAEQALEELCDKFAAAILIPKELVSDVISIHGISAKAVVELYESTSASRHCCAVALVDRMPSKGFIAIVNPVTQEVLGAAKIGDTSPSAFQGQRIPAAHALRRLSDENPELRTKSWWPRSENDRCNYYLDSVRHGRWDIAVFAERDLWEVEELHFSQAEPVRYDGEINCRCGYSGRTPWFPCNECKTSSCPRCRKCACDWRAETEVRAVCASCFQSLLTHLLSDGLCDSCR